MSYGCCHTFGTLDFIDNHWGQMQHLFERRSIRNTAGTTSCLLASSPTPSPTATTPTLFAFSLSIFLTIRCPFYSELH